MIDFLPRQVPKDADGQFFRIENYMLNNYEHYGLRDKFIRTILKLMCYCRVIVHWSEWIEQPAPELIAEIVDTIMDNHSGYMNMLLPDKNALLVFEWDCLNLTLYNPDTELIEFAELFKEFEDVQIEETATMTRIDDAKEIVVQFKYSSSNGRRKPYCAPHSWENRRSGYLEILRK